MNFQMIIFLHLMEKWSILSSTQWNKTDLYSWLRNSFFLRFPHFNFFHNNHNKIGALLSWKHYFQTFFFFCIFFCNLKILIVFVDRYCLQMMFSLQQSGFKSQSGQWNFIMITTALKCLASTQHVILLWWANRYQFNYWDQIVETQGYGAGPSPTIW